MVMAFPEGRGRIAHHKEHSVGEGLRLKDFHERPKLAPCFQGAKINKGLYRPFGLFGGMEIERPRSGRNGRMNGQFFIRLGHGAVIRRCIYAKWVVDFFKPNTIKFMHDKR